MQTDATTISFRLLSDKDRGAIELFFTQAKRHKARNLANQHQSLEEIYETSLEALQSKNACLIGCFSDRLVAIFIFIARNNDLSVYEFTMASLPFHNSFNVINDIFNIGVFFLSSRNCRVLVVDRRLERHESHRAFSRLPEIERDDYLFYFDIAAYMEAFQP